MLSGVPNVEMAVRQQIHGLWMRTPTIRQFGIEPRRPSNKTPPPDEIRAIRHRISEQFGHDPARLVAHYMERQEQHRDRLLRPEPSAKTSKG